MAESVGDPTLEASAAAYFAHLEALAGRPQPALIERAVRLEEEVGGLPLSVGPRSLLAKQRLWAGDLDAARELLELVHRDALRAGNQMKLPQHSYDLSLVECAAGNLDAAARAVHEGIEAAIDAENTYTERELLYPLALVQALTGRAAEAYGTGGAVTRRGDPARCATPASACCGRPRDARALAREDRRGGRAAHRGEQAARRDGVR